CPSRPLDRPSLPPSFPPSFPLSLPPSCSGDTGGLVEDDWTTPVAPKLDLLARVQPSPTQVRVDKAGKVTFS
ncbi:cellulase 1, partial [Nannochloropsis oceanica]